MEPETLYRLILVVIDLLEAMAIPDVRSADPPVQAEVVAAIAAGGPAMMALGEQAIYFATATLLQLMVDLWCHCDNMDRPEAWNRLRKLAAPK